MVAAITEKLPELQQLCRAHGIVRLWLFGSASGDAAHFDEQSDFDFLVEIDRGSSGTRGFADPFWQLTLALEDLLGRRVQLIEAGDVRKPSLRDAILRQRELIYDASRAVAAS